MDPLTLGDDGAPLLYYTTEATLRDGLARLAFLAGWHVETEHHVSGWGRLDLYLKEPDGSRNVVVELKIELTRASDIRKAFQQANAYAKAMDDEVILVAPYVDRSVAGRYEAAFPEIYLMQLEEFTNWLLGAATGMRKRHLLASERHKEISDQLALAMKVQSMLAAREASPLRTSGQ